MSKLKVNVGDEVYLKVKVTSIQTRTTFDDSEDYYLDVEYPDWFTEGRTRKATVTWNQHLLFTEDGKGA